MAIDEKSPGSKVPEAVGLWQTVSLVAFLPAAAVAVMVLASLPMAARSAVSEGVLAVVALALPISCLAGPVVVWNAGARLSRPARRLVLASPLACVLALAVLILLAP